jgi:glycosyltransferase involved in cell wall biosynthesis
LIKEFNVTPKRITVIPHGIDPVMKELNEGDDFRGRLDISKNAPVMLFFGSIRANKGLDVLLHAMPMVIKEYPGARLLIAGSMPFGESFEKYDRIIDDIKLRRNVICRVKWIDGHEVGLYFRAADLVILPYNKRFFSQSGVLLQAYKYGKPVVVTNVGALGETVKEDSTGIVVEPGPRDLSGAIVKLIKDKQRYSFYANNMLKAVNAKYSWDSVSRGTINVYKEVLNI